MAVLLGCTSTAGAQFQRAVVIDGDTPGLSLAAVDRFGDSIDVIGDLDANGTPDLAVGAPGDGRELPVGGAVWLLFMNPDGSVLRTTRLGSAEAGVPGFADARFGDAVAGVGDVNRDGLPDIAVSATAPGVVRPDGNGADSVRVLFLGADGGSLGGYAVRPEDVSIGQFGAWLAAPGDLNGDGRPDLIAGAGTVGGGASPCIRVVLGSEAAMAFDAVAGCPTTTIGGVEPDVQSGATTDDLDGDGSRDLVLGRAAEPGGWTFLDGSGVWKEHTVSSVIFSAPTPIDLAATGEVAWLADVDDNGFGEVALLDSQGRLWIVFHSPGGDPAMVVPNPRFVHPRWLDPFGLPEELAGLGDLDGDGAPDLAVGFPEQNRMVVLYGLQPPTPRFSDVEVPLFAIEGTPVTVRTSIADTRPLASATLSFRRSGDQDFLSFPLQPAADARWEATIPGFVVGNRGIDYRLEAVGSTGLIGRWPAGGSNDFIPSRLNEGLAFDLPAGTAADGFRLVSIPGRLDAPFVDSVLVDDLGPYDPSAWRAFGEVAPPGSTPFAPNKLVIPLGGVVEHGATTNSSGILLEPGYAFWLLSRNGGTFDTGPLTTENNVSRPLNPGWNLVGSPLPHTIPSENVRVWSDQYPNPLSPTPMELPTGASAPSGEVEAWRFDGSWAPHTGPWTPGEGYAVFNSGDVLDVISISQIAQTTAVASASKRSEVSWAIKVSAVKGRARDTHNVAILAPGASSGWDRLDKPEPPVIGDYLSISFAGERWDLSTDARPWSDGWRILVRTATPGVVRLRFDVPIGISATVFDPASGITHDARRGLEVTSAGQGSTRALELRTGEPEPRIPTDFGLKPAFPNPSAGPVTLVYRIPRRVRARLEVIDLLGRLADVLVDGAVEPGVHSVVWDAGGLAGGLYTARLHAEGQSSRTMLVLVR